MSGDQQEDFGAPDATIYVGPPLRGYRYWRLTTHQPGAIGVLRAVSQGREWTSGIQQAVCAPHSSIHSSGIHTPPVKGCGCGFYGWYTPKGAEKHIAANALGLDGFPNQAFGVFQASGRILPGRSGFKAQYAQILAVCFPRLDRADINLRHQIKEAIVVCRKRYPHVGVFDTAAEMLAEYPPQDVEGIRPPPPDYKSLVRNMLKHLDERYRAYAAVYVPPEAYAILEEIFDSSQSMEEVAKYLGVKPPPYRRLWPSSIEGVPVYVDTATRTPYLRITMNLSSMTDLFA